MCGQYRQKVKNTNNTSFSLTNEGGFSLAFFLLLSIHHRWLFSPLTFVRFQVLSFHWPSLWKVTILQCYCWIVISSESGQYTVHQQCHCDPCQVLALAWRISVKSDPLPSPGPDGPAATRSSSILCVSCWSCGVVETPAVDETKTEGWTDALTANGGSVIVCSSARPAASFSSVYTRYTNDVKNVLILVFYSKNIL